MPVVTTMGVVVVTVACVVVLKLLLLFSLIPLVAVVTLLLLLFVAAGSFLVDVAAASAANSTDDPAVDATVAVGLFVAVSNASLSIICFQLYLYLQLYLVLHCFLSHAYQPNNSSTINKRVCKILCFRSLSFYSVYLTITGTIL